MNIIISIVSVFGLLTIFYFMAVNYRQNQFQKNMKLGDNCQVFVGENRTNGKIVRILDNVVTVQTFLYGSVTVRREDVYWY